MPERLRFEQEMADLGLAAREFGPRTREFEQSSAQPDIVSIILLDPSGVFKDSQDLMKKVLAKLENKFNTINPSWQKMLNYKFVAIYKLGEPSDQAKAAFRKLDFPVYLLTKQDPEGRVTDLMEKHKVPKTGGKIDYYKYARASWSNEGLWGLGIPSEKGYRKVGFIKTHKVFEHARDWPRGFANAITHEIGHMGNKLDHSKTGIMKLPLPLDVDLNFNPEDGRLFFADLGRLKSMNRPIRLNWAFR